MWRHIHVTLKSSYDWMRIRICASIGSYMRVMITCCIPARWLVHFEQSSAKGARNPNDSFSRAYCSCDITLHVFIQSEGTAYTKCNNRLTKFKLHANAIVSFQTVKACIFKKNYLSYFQSLPCTNSFIKYNYIGIIYIILYIYRVGRKSVYICWVLYQRRVLY